MSEAFGKYWRTSIWSQRMWPILRPRFNSKIFNGLSCRTAYLQMIEHKASGNVSLGTIYSHSAWPNWAASIHLSSPSIIRTCYIFLIETWAVQFFIQGTVTAPLEFMNLRHIMAVLLSSLLNDFFASKICFNSIIAWWEPLLRISTQWHTR